MNKTLKFAGVADIDDVIRAYDFKPMLGRPDCFVEGKVEAINADNGYQAYKIRVIKDVFDGKEFTETAYKAVSGHRVGDYVYVPMEASRDYDARIINLSE